MFMNAKINATPSRNKVGLSDSKLSQERMHETRMRLSHLLSKVRCGIYVYIHHFRRHLWCRRGHTKDLKIQPPNTCSHQIQLLGKP